MLDFKLIYLNYIKRFLDILLSLVAIIILLPLFCFIYILIKIFDKEKVFFIQLRVGECGKTFNMYKFRTMKADCPKDTPTHLLIDSDKYITRTGKFLRKYSLDELPQIYNILKGDMSIVGPRPALLCQTDLLEKRKLNGSYDLKPGLTGYAQINGRDELTVYEKANFDAEYVLKVGLIFDIKIIARTILKIIKKEGVVEGGEKERCDNEKNFNYR